MCSAIVMITHPDGTHEVSEYAQGYDGGDMARSDWDCFAFAACAVPANNQYNLPNYLACDARFYQADTLSRIASLSDAGLLVKLYKR